MVHNLRYFSRNCPILQGFAHHIPDKLALSFNSFSSIGPKYSSVKSYNEEISFFKDFFYLFIRFQIHHLHVYFDMIPLRGAFKNSASSFFILWQIKHTSLVHWSYLYINCWSPVYSWSVIEKQITSAPPPPTHTHTIPENVCVGGGSGYLYLHYWPPVDREPAINVDKCTINSEKSLS